MPEIDDIELLAQYARDHSEAAFATLVTRHVNLVYSVALRNVGNPHAAEEITQAVFIILAKKAESLTHNGWLRGWLRRPRRSESEQARRGVAATSLSGWLYQTTRLTAANFLRTEIRRQRREQEAYMQSLLNETEPNVWPQIAPFLDAAMAGLGEKDRNAIVLRFFENKSLCEVGSALGASEDAAKMRVNRALEKLRKFFAKRGVALTTAIIAGAVSANAVQAAPAGLTISAVAAAKGSAATASTLTLVKGALKLMAWAKAKTAIVIGAAAILATGTTAVVVGEIATSIGADAARGPVEMKVKWQAGKRYVMRMEMTQTSETKQPNQPKPVKLLAKTTQDINFSLVKELDNGGRQLQLEIENQTMDVFLGDRRVVGFDSNQDPARDANDPTAVVLRKMVGARLQYLTAADGQVEKMEGYQELMNRMGEGGKPLVQATFKQMFTENGFRQYGLSLFAFMMPNRAVKVGDTWSRKLEVPDDTGMLNVDLRCTFKNWEQHADRKCARIKCTGNYSSQAAPNTSNLPAKIEKGTLSGEVWFDPELGMTAEIALDEDMILKITRQGQTLTSPVSHKTRLTLVDVEDLAK
jgi:RNA polymerase sigma factor (sigma-70 family)